MFELPKLHRIIAFLFLLPWVAGGQDFQTAQTIDLQYESTAKDKPESLKLIVQDLESKKSALLSLKQQDGGSGIYRANYQLNFDLSNKTGKYKIQIFVPPNDIDLMDEKQVEKYLSQEILVKKTFFGYREGNIVHLRVFDSRPQAVAALEQRKQWLASQAHVAPAQLQSMDQVSYAKAKEQAELKVQANRILLQKNEDLEKQRMLQLLREQSELSAQQRQKTKVQAAALTQKGLDAFTKSNYTEATKYFESAYFLDPEDASHLYQYGVALYKSGQFRKSLEILNLANDPQINNAEKQYYQGMDLLKLGDTQASWEKLDQVVNYGSEDLKPPAAFLQGVIDYENENYERAKLEFDFVLDHSKDPQLDRQAEKFIDQIANAMVFKAKSSQPWSAAVAVGMMYDSNILNLAAGNSTTNTAGLRSNYQASGEYRFVYKEKRELSIDFGASDMSSQTTSYQTPSTIQSQDPLQSFVYLPYRFRAVSDNAQQYSITPGYEVINMDPYATGTKTPAFNSWVIKFDSTSLPRPDRLVNHNLEIRRDISLIVTDVADNLSAYKYSYTWTNTFFMNSKKDSALIYDLILADNVADGANQAYYSAGGDAGYVTPWKWNSYVNAKIGAAYLPYATSALSRSDFTYNLNLGLRKPLTKTLSILLSAGYLVDNSNVTAYAYNKYTLGANLAWATNF